MNKDFKEGEYVHVPSGVIGYILDSAGEIRNYVKFVEPKLLMFLGERPDTKYGGINFCKLFYKGGVYSISKDNVYSRGEL